MTGFFIVIYLHLLFIILKYEHYICVMNMYGLGKNRLISLYYIICLSMDIQEEEESFLFYLCFMVNNVIQRNFYSCL